MNHPMDHAVPILWIKSSLYGVFLLVWCTMLFLVPKAVFDRMTPFALAASMASMDADNLLLYDYNVYVTEDRYLTGLDTDVDEVKAEFIERNEVMAVKVHGDTEKIEFLDDYLFIISPATPELNIEYYLVQNMTFDGMNLQCRTFVMLFQDIATLINNIYAAVLVIVSMAVMTPLAIGFARSVVPLISQYRRK